MMAGHEAVMQNPSWAPDYFRRGESSWWVRASDKAALEYHGKVFKDLQELKWPLKVKATIMGPNNSSEEMNFFLERQNISFYEYCTNCCMAQKVVVEMNRINYQSL